LAFAAGVLIKLFLFDLMITDGHSMEPAIRSGTILVINRLQYGFRFPGQKGYVIQWAMPRPGDVLIFYTPSGDIAVKRCEKISGTGSFIAIGDNAPQSYDSRSYGPIPINNTIGKVLGF